MQERKDEEADSSYPVTGPLLYAPIMTGVENFRKREREGDDHEIHPGIEDSGGAPLL